MVWTVEMEREREANLNLHIKLSLARADYQHWSREGCTSMSSMWLHSPPDQFGFIEDPLFCVIFATYLGQPCPAITPVVGKILGSSGTRVDAYGANLSAALLPGKGHQGLHDKLQSILQDMVKLGGIQSEKEAVNFLLGKVGKLHITSYVNHVSRKVNARLALHSIVPDIHAHNFPVRR